MRVPARQHIFGAADRDQDSVVRTIRGERPIRGGGSVRGGTMVRGGSALREPGLVRGARYVAPLARQRLVHDPNRPPVRNDPATVESGGNSLQHIGGSGPVGGAMPSLRIPVAARQLSRRDCAPYRVNILRLYPSCRIDFDSGSEKNDPLLWGIRRTRQCDGGLSENGTLYRSSLLSG